MWEVVEELEEELEEGKESELEEEEGKDILNSEERTSSLDWGMYD